MKVMLVGGKGMLGTDFVTAASQTGLQVKILDLPEFDLCNKDQVAEGIRGAEIVLNCAAFTRVDDAEKERELSHRINATGAGILARACAARGVKLIHISTDYVYNGRKGSPYVESDPVDPLNYYGVTKLEGEKEVLSAPWSGKARCIIVRTQSLYGLNGRNFVKAILGQLHQGKTELRVVNDQVSSPTYTKHLAAALLRLMPVDREGIVHVACSGGCSWFDFAKAIVERVGAKVSVLPRSTAELNYPALRPAFSILDTSLYTSWTGHTMPSWQEGLDDYLKEEPLAKF